jgi:transposase-like protein
MRYTEVHKHALVSKALDSNGKTIEEIARENGVHPASLGRWLKLYRSGKMATGTGDDIRPSHRNPGEKLSLLLESKKITPETLGEWLRQHGLHSEHLKLWEQELSTMANDNQNKEKEETAKLRKENRELRKDLARKEKALAEAAVLLTLKKKFPTLFEDNEEV